MIEDRETMDRVNGGWRFKVPYMDLRIPSARDSI